MPFMIRGLLLSVLAATAMASEPKPVSSDSQSCPSTGNWLQVLGSGGPEISDGRASASYLIWQDGKARVLIDMGSGSLTNFEKSGARFEDLKAVAFTHFHIDHSADFPSLIKGGFFTSRTEDLPVFGPATNQLLPGADAFVQRLFRNDDKTPGVWPYLAGYLPDSPDGSERYRILPVAVNKTGNASETVLSTDTLRLSTISVNHGPLPALAWRVDVGEKTNESSVVISGDMSDKTGHLQTLLKGSDLFIAHNAVPENAGSIARRLHMPPSRIAANAAEANVPHLVLAHIMTRSARTMEDTKQIIRREYKGQLSVASDLSCYRIGP